MSNKIKNGRPKVKVSYRWTTIAAILAALFGIATIWSGGSVIFDVGKARLDAGNYVSFVVWFNFLAGFFYVLAGIGLFVRRSWAVGLSILIAVATLLVFGAFAIHILSGDSFEPRTVGAMILRSTFWLVIAWYAKRSWSDGGASR